MLEVQLLSLFYGGKLACPCSHSVMDGMCVSSPNSYVEILTPKVTELGGGLLEGDWVMRVEPSSPKKLIGLVS